MPDELKSILSTLEKPLTFISKNNYSNIDKVKSLPDLVGDLTFKALSLPLGEELKDTIESIKNDYSDYEQLSEGDKKNLIKKTLKLISPIINDSSKGAAKRVERERKLPEEHEPLSDQATQKVSLGDDLSKYSIQYVKGVGPRIASLLKKKGIENIENALYYFPRKYEDRTTIKSISKLIPGQRETFIGEVMASGRVRTRRGSMYQVALSDSTAMLTLVWFKFSEKYLKSTYKKGVSVILTGEVTYGYRDALQIVHPRPEDIEVIEPGEDIDHDNVHFNRIVPIYPLTEGIGQRRMRSIMKSVVDDYSPALKTFLPASLNEKRNLLEFNSALQRVHFPLSDDPVVDIADSGSVYGSSPHKTLSYSELFLTELGLALKKRDVAKLPGISFAPTGELTKALLSRLKFNLTGAQERAVSEIESDMRSPKPMNRLLQGDVGSGKTIVAMLSLLKAVESGYQAVFMAPTEILAEQHLASVLNSVKAMGLRVVFLKSGLGKSEKNTYYKALQSGEAQIAVGTHALLQEKVDFKNLGLVVIDEQHRFGVMQRAELMGKGNNPDMLVMTATPIPRTLALTVYGDLDVSILDELPPGRKKIKTKLYYDHKGAREKAYETVRKEIAKGRQAYVVYPMIEESENPDFKDLKYATQMAEELAGDVFPEYTIGLLHGKMKTDEKEAVMKRFISNHVQILVSTTVIEVGVDVPNATVMVIENAERFGLTQLHQLRGRIGRGEHDSICILLSGYKRSQDADKRLTIMEQTTDGFKIAEADLEIRGPGDFLGTKQSGLPEFRFANILRDTRILSEAREDAFALVKYDPDLSKYPDLLEEVLRRFGSVAEVSAIS